MDVALNSDVVNLHCHPTVLSKISSIYPNIFRLCMEIPEVDFCIQLIGYMITVGFQSNQDRKPALAGAQSGHMIGSFGML